MLKFLAFIKEELLFEAKESEWGLKKTDAGKMHEVLTGGLINHYGSVYQKNKSKGHEAAHKTATEAISSPPRTATKGGPKIANIEHMAQFKDEKANKSAKEWHEHLSKGLSQEHYDGHLAHAQHAAKNIIRHAHEQGMTDIKKAHFTANEKDIEKLTGGKDSSKKGNNSDIVVEHGHKDKGDGFHGVSLKSGGSSKLFNPGMGGISKVIDSAHEKATGKRGSMSETLAKVDKESTDAHHKVLVKHASALSSHFGGSHVKHDKAAGTVHVSEHALNTMRYAHEKMNSKTPEKTRVNELKGVSADKVKKLGGVYGELQNAKLTSYKHPASSSLHKHLKNIFNATGSKAKQAQHDVITSLTNTPVRDESHMKVMRHNTEYKKGERVSKIAYGIGDATNKTHKYEIKHGGGINNEIIGRDKKGNKTMHVSVVADASPSHGTGTGARKGLHVWDKMKE
jgi:hypothetical protein